MRLSELYNRRRRSSRTAALAVCGFLLLVIYLGNFFDLLFITFLDKDLPGKVLKNLYLVVPLLLPVSWLYWGRVSLNIVDTRWIIYLGFLAILALGFSAGDGSSTFGNLRLLLVFPIFYLIGKSLYLLFGYQALRILVTFHIGAVFLIFLVGLIEVAAGQQFWAQFDVFDYYASKVDRDFWQSNFGVPRSWVSWDLVPYIGRGVRRMVSLVLEPAGIGRLFAVATIMVLYFRDLVPFNLYTRTALFMIFVVGGLMTVSKGFIFLVAFYAVAHHINIKQAILVFVSVIGAMILLVMSGQSAILGPSFLNHLSNIYFVLEALYNNPTGFGISVDHVASVSDAVNAPEDGRLAVRSEGGIMVFALLFGWLGILLYALLFRVVMLPKIVCPSLLRRVVLLAFTVLLSSTIAHSAFSAVGSGLVFMLLGAVAEREAPRTGPVLLLPKPGCAVASEKK